MIYVFENSLLASYFFLQCKQKQGNIALNIIQLDYFFDSKHSTGRTSLLVLLNLKNRSRSNILKSDFQNIRNLKEFITY